MSNVQLLPKRWVGTGEVKGFLFSQIDSSEKGYIYKVIFEDDLHYEVIRRRTTPVCLDFHKRIYSETDVKEIYPKANHFGKRGWSLRTLEEAKEKLLSLEE